MRSPGNRAQLAPSLETARPLVSVIVPTYNAERYIADTIASALAQTYPNKEVIVVDDCSSDATESIVRRLAERDARVRLIRFERNSGGPARGRNVGAEQAMGDYLAFLDADDLWHPQKLELQLNALLHHQSPFVCSDLVPFDDGRERELSELRERVYDLAGARVDRITHGRLLRKNVIPNSSVLIDRRAFERVRFDEERAMVAVEDYECWLTLHQQMSHSIRLKLPLLYYRCSPSSISSSKVAMLKKVNYMLKRYSVDGKPLGWLRYFYLSTYAVLSLWTRLVR